MVIAQKHKNGSFQYYNLRTNQSYTLVHDDSSKVSTEVHVPPAEDFLTFLDNEASYLQKSVDTFKGEDKIQLKSLQYKLDFILGYDPIESVVHDGDKLITTLKIK